MTLIFASNWVISIHAAREGGDQRTRLVARVRNISIHAAREGGDECNVPAVGAVQISIHAAREGGDQSVSAIPISYKDFNPRRP